MLNTVVTEARVLVLFLSAVMLAACASRDGMTTDMPTPSPDAEAHEQCSASAYAHSSMFSVQLVGAFRSTAAEVAHWDETRTTQAPGNPHPVSSRWRSIPSGQVMYVCYFDGFIPAPGPPGHAPYDRFDVIVSSGIDTLDRAGQRASLAIEPPR